MGDARQPEASEAKTASEPASTSASATGKAEKKPLKITVAYAAVAGSYAPLWVAKEKGLDTKYGLDFDLQYVGAGTTLIQSMASGEINVANTGGEGIVNADLAGGDLVIIAATNNILGFSLFSQPNIQRIEDLKGKTVGITKFGSSTDVAARLTLKKFGLEPDKDVAIVQSGGTPETMGAMKAGGIQGTVTGPPNSLSLKKAGMRELVSIADLNIPYTQTCIGVSRQYLAKNPEVVKSFLQAYVEGIAQAKQDKAFATEVLGRYTSTDDQAVLDETYDFYVTKLLPKVPVVNIDGVQTILEESAREEVPRAKETKPETFVDDRIMKELDQSGFIKSLYKE